MTTFRSGYGDFTYGNLLYGIDAADITGAASAGVSCSVSASSQVVRDGLIQDVSTVTASVAAYTSLAGKATSSISSSVDIYWNRVMSFEASTAIVSDDTEVSARYKWLDASDPTTTWTTADYLERAA